MKNYIQIIFTVALFLCMTGCDFTKTKAPINKNESIIGKWAWTDVKNNGLEPEDFKDYQAWQKCERNQIKELKVGGDVTTSGGTCNGINVPYTYNSYSIKGDRFSMENATGIAVITKTTLKWTLDGNSSDPVIRFYTRQ